MGKPDTSNLWLRGRTYSAVLWVPEEARIILRKRHLVRSLKTRDLAEARRLSRPVLAEFQRLIDQAKAAVASGGDDLTERAMAIRRFAAAQDERYPLNAGDIAMLEVAGVERHHGPEAAASFYRVAIGVGTPIMHHVDAWLRETTYRPRSQGQHKGTLNELVRWCSPAKVLPEIEAIDRQTAGQFVTDGVTKGENAATINRKLSTLKAFWDWLVKKGHVKGNPWEKQALPKQKITDPDEKNRAFTADEMRSLLSAETDPVLRDFMRIAALTGMRLESIGQLRVQDCEGGEFAVLRDKTQAGTRRLPIHSALSKLVAARCEGKARGDWLFHELDTTKRGERSSAVGKRFLTLRVGLGIDDKIEGKRNARATFHSFRRWLITEAVRANPSQLPVVQQIVGHKAQGVTMGVYFGGFTMEVMRACIESVKLPVEPPPAAPT
jgi:integrase